MFTGNYIKRCRSGGQWCTTALMFPSPCFVADPTEPEGASAPPLEIVNEELTGVNSYRLSKLAYRKR